SRSAEGSRGVERGAGETGPTVAASKTGIGAAAIVPSRAGVARMTAVTSQLEPLATSAGWSAKWALYAIEGALLGTFMVSACVFTALMEHPHSPVRKAVSDPLTRRALIGLAMGITAVLLIYSQWGKRSGAHMNPAITICFLRLGRIDARDAAG